MKPWIAIWLWMGCGVAWGQGEGFMEPLPKGQDPRSVQHSGETPRWENPKAFARDVFTFARIHYHQKGRDPRGGWTRKWSIDYPDADLNLSFRLQQMTAMRVDPNGVVLDITDPDLVRYPFVYMVEPGQMEFTAEEVPILRRYLLNGGFLMVDDFWGEPDWQNMARQLARVFPDRKIFDIPRSHPVFHCVFDLPASLNLQVPNVRLGSESQFHGITWEREDAREVHIRGINDDRGRLCVILCHNTDNGDGWEREGENEYFFREFSEKKSFPLGINIVFYAMTH